jgi:ribosomal protein L7/L12
MFGKKHADRSDEFAGRSVRQEEIRQYAHAGQMIRAIKIYREDTGASLADARAAVERIAASSGGDQQSFSSFQESSVASAANVNTDALEAEIEAMLIQGSKIHAIKLYREHTGVGLTQAKDAVDKLESQLLRYGPRFSSSGYPGSSFAYTDDPYGPAALQSTQPSDDPYGPAAFNGQTSQSPDEEVRRLVRAGKKIEAIKLYRQQTGLGLAQAKAAIDLL